MEKALTTVGSFWISKKAKQEFSNISHDISSLSNSVEDKAKCLLNKLKGKSRKEIGDVLREYNIPGGVLPSNIKCYEYEESKGKLTVHLPYPCEVCFKDSSLIRYSTRVKAALSRGKLTVLDGMKTKMRATSLTKFASLLPASRSADLEMSMTCLVQPFKSLTSNRDLIV